MNIVGALYHKL